MRLAAYPKASPALLHGGVISSTLASMPTILPCFVRWDCTLWFFNSTTWEVTIEPSTAVNCQPLESNQTFSVALNRVLSWRVLWDKEPQLSELNGDGVIIPAVRFGRIHYEWLARYLYLPLSTLNWYRNHVNYPNTEHHNLYHSYNQ